MEVLGATAKYRLLHFGDCFGDFNSSRAGFGAVEGCAATPHAFFVIQNVEAHLCSLVP